MGITFIYPYMDGSKSARALRRALPGRLIRRKGSRFKPRGQWVVNWGCSDLPHNILRGCNILNHPDQVYNATNKLRSFEVLTPGCSIPDWSTCPQEATEWLSEGSVVCRQRLEAHSGEGITIATTEQELVEAPLYVKYIKKKSEWRVHIFKGEVLMVQRKVRNMDVPAEEVKWQIRNHRNGFVYQQHGINPSVQVMEEASKAVALMGLDFAAVDVVYNDHYDKAYVLEVNCAPGLEGATLERYANAIRGVTNEA